LYSALSPKNISNVLDVLVVCKQKCL